MYHKALWLDLSINDMYKVSTVKTCIPFADDTNFLYIGYDISEMWKIVSSQLDKVSILFDTNKSVFSGGYLTVLEFLADHVHRN